MYNLIDVYYLITGSYLALKMSIIESYPPFQNANPQRQMTKQRAPLLAGQNTNKTTQLAGMVVGDEQDERCFHRSPSTRQDLHLDIIRRTIL